MIGPLIANAVTAVSALTAQALSTNTNGTAVDISGYEGNILAIVNSAAASTGDTLDVTVEESADNSSWAAVPADALFVPSTGAAGTFTQVTASAASFQVMALRNERLKKYIRLVFTVAGGSISIPCAATFVVSKKYVS